MKKDARSNWLQKQVSVLTSVQMKAEEELSEKHREKLDLELRKYRRRALLNRHNVEQDLIREVKRIAYSKIKSSLNSGYYAEACNEWRGPSLAPWQQGLKETPQRWRAVGDIVPDLTAPEIETQAFRADINVVNRYAHNFVSFLKISVQPITSH